VCRTDGTHFQTNDVTSRKTLVSTLSLVRHHIYVSVRFVTLLQPNKYQVFIGKLAILRKTTIGFVTSACLPVRPSVRLNGKTRLPLDRRQN
jgi:hypothetical protein